MSGTRPEVSGRKIGSTAATKMQKPTTDRDAYSVPEFCRRHNISNGTYYRLRLKDLGPKEAHVLGRVLITREAAEAWRRAREETEPTEVA